MNEFIEEGDKCPHCEGRMRFPKVENCSCHISAPCGPCVECVLTCNQCGWQCEPPKPSETYRSLGPVAEVVTKNPVHDFGNGKRIYDFDYNSASGSTMVWSGRYKGDVTKEDIIGLFGDGTFGHRGPSILNGRFTYTKITD